MQLHTDSELELELALGGTYRQARIAKLEHQIARLKKERKSTAIVQRKLVFALCDQMNWELRVARLMGAA